MRQQKHTFWCSQLEPVLTALIWAAPSLWPRQAQTSHRARLSDHGTVRMLPQSRCQSMGMVKFRC